jgi:serine/threonine protein kinase
LMSLSRALETAHGFALDGVAQNLVHRDVSPANVLISRTGEVKLSDFGIAKSSTREPHTTAGVVRGKFAYMSPEQTRGEALDQRSDLFALGVIAYQLFTGSHPFRPGPDGASAARGG